MFYSIKMNVRVCCTLSCLYSYLLVEPGVQIPADVILSVLPTAVHSVGFSGIYSEFQITLELRRGSSDKLELATFLLTDGLRKLNPSA